MGADRNVARDLLQSDFHLPEGMAYTCHNTAVCCNVFEAIPAEDGVRAVIDRDGGAELNAAAQNPPGFPLIADTPAGDSLPGTAVEAGSTPYLARKACGSCALLTPDHLCAVHALAGEAAKPQACQDFPWRYVETPGGVYVGLSFVCPSVRHNRGQRVSDQRAAVAQRYARAASVREVPSTIWLNSRRSLTWSDYLTLESALVDLISDESLPLTVRLVGCCIFPGFADHLLTESERSGAPVSFPEIIEKLKARNYDIIVALASKARARESIRPRRMFLGMLTSFANTLQRQKNQGRLATVSRVMLQYLRSAAGVGRLNLKPVEHPVDHARLDGASLPDDGEAARQITRYLRHCIERKDLVLFGDVNRRMRLLATSAALTAWYAAALAGDAPPDSAHWDEAIGIVERLYGFHSTFYQFFEKNRAFADIVDSFVLKPAFPYMLLR